MTNMALAPFNDHLHLSFQYDQRLGFYQWEKKRKQKLLVDVRIEFDARAAFRSDHLKDTVDYDVVDEEIRKVLKRKHYHLIETIAEETAKALFKRWKIIRAATITIDKPLALKHARQVSFCIYRKRGAKKRLARNS